VALTTPHFGKNLRAHVPGNVRVKFEVRSFCVLELLAFNAEKIRVSRDPGHAHFRDCSQNILFEM